MATVVDLQAKVIDDALELFDYLMVHEMRASAQRTTREETLRRYPQVSKNAGKLAAAMAVLVRMRDSGASLDPEAIWQAVEQVVSWSEIRTAVPESLRCVVPAPGEDPDAAWRVRWWGGTRPSAGSCPSWWPPSSSGRPPGRGPCSRRSGSCPTSWFPDRAYLDHRRRHWERI
ncbi:MAG TPA: hypothetical protein VHA57_05280 [Actinomycetota bacterium]|nr:hypothetical protein [Actinomycetota bacterium]